MGLIDKIKSNAWEKGVAIEDGTAKKIRELFNQAFYMPKKIEEETKFVKQVMTRGQDSQERKGLHASNMLVGESEFCIRSQVLSLLYRQNQGEQLQPSLLRIFEQGNAIHEKWQRLFIRAGYGEAEDMDFTRFNARYAMSFTPDALIHIPGIFNDEWIVVEIKSVNTFQFQRMDKHPSAWKQCQWYMHNLGFKHGIVLSEDKNTQDFKIEVYDYDSKLVAPFVERAESIIYYYNRVVTEHKMVARPKEAKSPDSKKCKECPLKDACWNIGMGRVRLD